MQQKLDSNNQNRYPEDLMSSTPSFFITLWQLPWLSLKMIVWPSKKTVSQEIAKAHWGIVILQFLILVALTAGINTIGQHIPTATLHTIADIQLGSFSLFHWLPAPFNGIILLFVSFLIGLFTAYPFSKLSRGQGKFVEHTYLLLLFTIPLVIISGALLLIPASGSLVGILIGVTGILFLYRMVLHTITIKVVHHLSVSRAILIVLIIPMVLLIICILILAIFTEGGALELFGIGDLFDFGSHSKKKGKQANLDTYSHQFNEEDKGNFPQSLLKDPEM